MIQILQDLSSKLDGGKKLPLADGILINGRGNGYSLTVQQGRGTILNIFFFFDPLYQSQIEKKLERCTLGLQEKLTG